VNGVAGGEKSSSAAASLAGEKNSIVAVPRKEKTNVPSSTNKNAKLAASVVRGTATDDDDEAAWRIEVMDRGKRYILRRGSGDLRETYPGGGGKFENINDESRKENYYANSETQSRRKRAAEQKRKSRHGSERDS
jgi:hypothetical protein